MGRGTKLERSGSFRTARERTDLEPLCVRVCLLSVFCGRMPAGEKGPTKLGGGGGQEFKVL